MYTSDKHNHNNHNHNEHNDKQKIYPLFFNIYI